jgi:periplasmic protein TonB
MDDRKDNSYFILGGVYSIIMLLSIFVFFAYTLYSSQKEHLFAMNKDKAINISIAMDTPVTNTEKKVEEAKQEVKETQSVPPQKESTPPKEVTSVKNEVKKENVSTLFSNVSTKPIEHKKSEEAPQYDQKQMAVLNKKIDISKQNDVASVKQMIDNTKFAKSAVKVTPQSASSGLEVNKYLAKIQAQIYDNFYPPLNTQGQSAKVLLRLDESGHVLDFRVITYSGSELFNEEVDRLKKRVVLQKFPLNPNGISGNYVITLVAKE